MTRERLLQNIDAQVDRVRNNGARRRLQKAVALAKVKLARAAEIERMRAAKREELERAIHTPSSAMRALRLPDDGEPDTLDRRIVPVEEILGPWRESMPGGLR